jgi:hypothetical protein
MDNRFQVHKHTRHWLEVTRGISLFLFHVSEPRGASKINIMSLNLTIKFQRNTAIQRPYKRHLKFGPFSKSTTNPFHRTPHLSVTVTKQNLKHTSCVKMDHANGKSVKSYPRMNESRIFAPSLTALQHSLRQSGVARYAPHMLLRYLLNDQTTVFWWYLIPRACDTRHVLHQSIPLVKTHLLVSKTLNFPRSVGKY